MGRASGAAVANGALVARSGELGGKRSPSPLGLASGFHGVFLAGAHATMGLLLPYLAGAHAAMGLLLPFHRQRELLRGRLNG